MSPPLQPGILAEVPHAARYLSFALRARDAAPVLRSAGEGLDDSSFLALLQRQRVHDFAAFGHSLDAFEAQLRRMARLDDGAGDALFGVSRPVSGACFWCPPLYPRGGPDLRGGGL
jgi:deferrochelatase/peroxidase EfeB